MKSVKFFLTIVAAAATFVSCDKESRVSVPGSDAKVQTLRAVFAPGETRTFFDGATFKWKTNDNCVVRSNNANGYSTFKYTGEATAGEAVFTNDSEDAITYGQNSFAIYPAKVNGSYPCEEDGSLKVVLKDSYTWATGNVEAPMLARVESGEPLQFKHLGGCLKVTYKYIPPKATKLVIKAPVVDAELLAAGKNTYKICQTMNQTYNWTTAGGGFDLDPANVPYVKAYDHSGDYKITVNISAATAAQRASDDGVTVYIPLPVGPELVGGKNVYPQIKMWLAFNDDSVVPGSLKTATNVQIERASIKPMEAIALTKYSISVLSGVDNSKAPDTEGKLNNIRGLARQSDGNLIIMESAGSRTRSLRFVDVSDGTFTTFRDNSKLGDPWHGDIVGNMLYFTDKSKGKVFSMDLSAGTKAVTEEKSGLSQAMDIKFDASGNAYVLLRDTGVYKYTGGISGAQSVFAPLASFGGTGVTLLSMGFDPAGNLLVGASASSADNTNGFRIYKVTSDGTVSSLAGTGVKATSFANTVDGALDVATFSANVSGFAFDANGNVFVNDNSCVRKITVSGAGNYNGAVITTVLGGGSSYTSACGATALFGSLYDIISSADKSKLFVIDQDRGTLRQITIE